MKKNKKSKNTVEFHMSAEDMLEFLNFLEYVKGEKEAWCNSAGKVYTQMKELVVARIEGRKPRVVLDGQTVLSLDPEKLMKLAFKHTAVDNALRIQKYQTASVEEIVRTMEAPPAEKVVTEGEKNAVARREASRKELMDRIDNHIKQASGSAVTSSDQVSKIAGHE